MGRFDGVALAAVDAENERARVAGQRALVSELEHGRQVRLADRRRAVVWRAVGLPPTIAAPTPDRDGSHPRFVVIGLRASPPGRWGSSTGGSTMVLSALAGHGDAGQWRVGRLGVVPPAPVNDLRGCRPLARGRTHVAKVGTATTACGRLPARGEHRDPSAVDCLRCLRSTVVASRHDQQLTQHRRLVELAGPLVAGAIDRLWARVDYRDPGQLPALLDSMAGAIVFRMPGAPNMKDTLVLVRRYREIASDEVLRWAGVEARRWLAQRLPHLAASHPTSLTAEMHRQLTLPIGLLAPWEAAEVLVTVLEDHGPAPALEPITLSAARRAGDTVSERVDRWRRIHSVAHVLSGARS